MTGILAAPYKLLGLARINVIVGRNGCGKSTLLKGVEAGMPQTNAHLKYVTPERGGSLVYEAGVEQNTLTNANWLQQTRRANQFQNFKQQTVAQYRGLETKVLRVMEAKVNAGQADEATGFDVIIQSINTLLDNIEIRRGTSVVFDIISRRSGEPVPATQISSGESELIALAIECLAFAFEVVPGAQNILFLDEPDVHLHPDLQARLVRFLTQLANEYDFTVIVATHSTAFLSELTTTPDASVAFMTAGDTELSFQPVGKALRQILPVFGAHPLSNVFNQSPVLIVEGEDDVRIWQQAVRTANGNVALYPVECGGLPFMALYERLVDEVGSAIYETSRAMSLRDGDDSPEDLSDQGSVVRLRLHCRAAENLLLSDESLHYAGTDWDATRARLEDWIRQHADHPRHLEMARFRDSGFDRRYFDLKDLRMIMAADGLAISRPWEVHVGRVLGQLAAGEVSTPPGDGSLLTYLGPRAASALLSL